MFHVSVIYVLRATCSQMCKYLEDTHRATRQDIDKPLLGRRRNFLNGRGFQRIFLRPALLALNRRVWCTQRKEEEKLYVEHSSDEN